LGYWYGIVVVEFRQEVTHIYSGQSRDVSSRYCGMFAVGKVYISGVFSLCFASLTSTLAMDGRMVPGALPRDREASG